MSAGGLPYPCRFIVHNLLLSEGPDGTGWNESVKFCPGGRLEVALPSLRGVGQLVRADSREPQGKLLMERLVDFVDVEMDFVFTGGGTVTLLNPEKSPIEVVWHISPSA
jgi:hypothetical protein